MVRRFALASIVAFGIVVSAIYVLQQREEEFFAGVQEEQARFVAQIQAQHERRQRETSLAALMEIHEAGHVSLANFLASTLWARHLKPFIARAHHVPVDDCRRVGQGGTPEAARIRAECFAAVGRRIRALPEFASLDRAAREATAATNVYKIKVFDLRGVTLYSSEHGQVGEDKADNHGWRSASRGVPASELTHRDRFSAFEGVVENRDVFSTYVPARRAGVDAIIGVFEIYSDATPFIASLSATGVELARTAESNEALFSRAAADKIRIVHHSSEDFLLIVYGLLALLYLALLAIVRNGQRVIDRQARAQQESSQREKQWHREKMAALATMAANVSHEVGNPLAIISGHAQDLAARLGESDPPAAEQAARVIGETSRIASMMREIADFASSRREAWEFVDLNAKVGAVCRFLGFDHEARIPLVDFRPGQGLPACAVVPDYLNEILMSVLQRYARQGASAQARRPVLVETFARDGVPVVRIGCTPDPGDGGAGAGPEPAEFDGVRQRIRELRARLVVTDRSVELRLPTALPDAGSDRAADAA